MLDSVLATGGSVTLEEILICTAVTLLLGGIIAVVYMYRNAYSKNFILTVALLPVIVQSVIMVVNGNLGTGVAVAGAFGLVRFRSAPGNAREIISIFFAMAIGLSAGMGYLVYATLFTVIISVVMLVYTRIGLGDGDIDIKTLKITIPEDMDYVHAFDDLFKIYTKEHSLDKVRTTNLGGLFELQYTANLKSLEIEKEFIDKIRQRNGNLGIVIGRSLRVKDEL